jgi:hypothetical protein
MRCVTKFASKLHKWVVRRRHNSLGEGYHLKLPKLVLLIPLDLEDLENLETPTHIKAMPL